MAVLSLTKLLRIGEAWTISLPGDGKLCFMGEKSRSGEHEQDPGRRVGCDSSKRNVKNVVWQKTAHMVISHQQTWKRHGWRLWRAQNSSTTCGTVCGEAA